MVLLVLFEGILCFRDNLGIFKKLPIVGGKRCKVHISVGKEIFFLKARVNKMCSRKTECLKQNNES